MNEYREYFNKAASKALATTDKDGNPNVCLCGSAFMIDESTIIAASGFFDKTEKNIKETNKAVFMAFQPLSSEYWKHYEETGQQQFPAGIRFYCILKETATDGPMLEGIKKRLRERVGNRIPDSLKKLLFFSVVEIRKLKF
jgi:hypothetical protein